MLASTVEDMEKEETHGLGAKQIHRTDGPFCRNCEETRATLSVPHPSERMEEQTKSLKLFKLTLTMPMRLSLQDLVPSKYCALTIKAPHMNLRGTHLHHSRKQFKIKYSHLDLSQST